MINPYLGLIIGPRTASKPNRLTQEEFGKVCGAVLFSKDPVIQSISGIEVKFEDVRANGKPQEAGPTPQEIQSTFKFLEDNFPKYSIHLTAHFLDLMNAGKLGDPNAIFAKPTHVVTHWREQENFWYQALYGGSYVEEWNLGDSIRAKLLIENSANTVEQNLINTAIRAKTLVKSHTSREDSLCLDWGKVSKGFYTQDPVLKTANGEPIFVEAENRYVKGIKRDDGREHYIFNMTDGIKVRLPNGKMDSTGVESIAKTARWAHIHGTQYYGPLEADEHYPLCGRTIKTPLQKTLLGKLIRCAENLQGYTIELKRMFLFQDRKVDLSQVARTMHYFDTYLAKRRF
jgi:hypothetical protein